MTFRAAGEAASGKVAKACEWCNKHNQNCCNNDARLKKNTNFHIIFFPDNRTAALHSLKSSMFCYEQTCSISVEEDQDWSETEIIVSDQSSINKELFVWVYDVDF